jgi:hypothetical protein
MSREGILRNWMDQHDSASSNHEQGNGTVRDALSELERNAAHIPHLSDRVK